MGQLCLPQPGNVYRNPETGEEGRKHSWVVLHDGLIFGSGWYEAE